MDPTADTRPSIVTEEILGMRQKLKNNDLKTDSVFEVHENRFAKIRYAKINTREVARGNIKIIDDLLPCEKGCTTGKDSKVEKRYS